MREIRTSGSTSGDVETEHGTTIEAPVTKDPETARSCLNHRATPRLYYSGADGFPLGRRLVVWRARSGSLSFRGGP